MKKTPSKLIALLLAVMMVFSVVAPAMATGTTEDGELSRVEKLVAEMSLRDKVTQMLMVDFRDWGFDEKGTAIDFTVMNDEVRQIIEDYNFGSIILFADNIKETEQSYNLTMAMQEAATKDGGIALIICADQEGGSVYRLGSGTALPGNMALGATYANNGTQYALEAGRIIGSELDAVGINGNLAPVVDVNNNANNPVIGLRSYSDDATMVGELASASIAGMAEYNVIGTAKHFPGHGDTATDSHYGLPMVDKSLEVLMETELMPYTVAIEQGIEMIMTAHILYPQLESDKIVSNKTGEAESLPATMSDDILTGLLKGDMGFEGIVVTDAMNMAGISGKWDQVQSCVIAIQAGVDLICMPCTLSSTDSLANLDAIINGIIAAVEDGTIPMERIDDAVTRILTVKENRGILDYDPAEHTLEKALEVVGSDANREMERELAAAAVTVIKNDGTLPLNITENSKVLMLMPYNNERAQMLMAWNRAKEVGLIPEGAEVDYFRFSSTTVSAELQTKLDWADTYIIITEVSSTARMNYKHWLSAMPNKLCDYAAENGKKAVIASCDKPYDVQMYPNANAILAAYGCKGSSVDPTEALIGGATGSTAAYGPNIIAAVEVALGTFGAQGKLPVNIPVYDAEANNYSTELVYERGYGLTYDAKVERVKMLIDETTSFELEGDLSAADLSTVNTDVATVELTVTPGVTEYTLSENVTAIESGKTYVFCNKGAQKLISNEWADASVGGGGSDGLSLGSTTDNLDENDLWTVTATEGGFYVQDKDGKYMSIARGKGQVKDEPVVINLDFDGTDWTIGENGEYANDFGGAHTAVAGWNDINDVNSQWEVYEVTTTTGTASTTVTITAIGVGSTYAKIGDMTYQVIVACPYNEWSDWTETKAPTCTEAGEETRSCVCGETETREIPALGHNPAEAVVENDVKPTCTEAGSYDSVVYCATCGTELSRETIAVDALGHDYVDGSCTVCGEADPNYAEVIAKGWSGYTTWVLTSDGVLTFSPTEQTFGEDNQTNMKNYWKVNGVLTLPWGDYAEQITKVVIEEGIHDIGQMAFYELPNLVEVVLPESAVEIRNYTFKNCKALTTINLEVVENICEGAFYGCSALENITFADNVTIADWAFSKTPYSSMNP